MSPQAYVPPALLKEAGSQPAATAGDMPFILFASPEMRLYSPDEMVSTTAGELPLSFEKAVKASSRVALIPRPEECRALWDAYAMLPNIREHCSKVAVLTLAITQMAQEKGHKVSPEAAYAAGLLHDLGKTYSISNGGNHAQIGAAWVMRETRNPVIAQAVLFHVNFPWHERIDECLDNDAYFICFAVAYADKRVKHDTYVSIDERFADLRDRYGVNAYALEKIEASRLQGKHIEEALSKKIGVELDAYTPDYGRLVR